jgi:hypothetical protein
VSASGKSRAFVDHPNLVPSVPISAVPPPWVRVKVISHVRYVTFQVAEIAASRQMFADILSMIARPRACSAPA